MSESNKHQYYKEFPKTCLPDDFWGQVKRTINGQPVGQDQIDLLVDAIVTQLQLSSDDVLLDLCCGNGALSDLVFARCRGGLGVDFSEFLIKVAQTHFQQPPHRLYVLDDVDAFVRRSNDTDRYTKALCCSAIQYFPDALAVDMLTNLRTRFPNINKLFLGNIPDRTRLDEFCPPEKRTPGIEMDPDTAIGIWRSQDDMAELAAQAGWTISFSRMPAAYFAAHYRFDATLSPASLSEGTATWPAPPAP
jgi:SAM-dependent methyltransferase